MNNANESADEPGQYDVTTNDTTEIVKLQKEITLMYAPVIVSTAILAAIGVIGNIFAVIFYGFKQSNAPRTSTFVLITYLAIADLVVCILSGFVCAELALNVNYQSRAQCKVAHYLGHVSVDMSISLLAFIAVDRYRKVCVSDGRNITPEIAKRVSNVFLVLAVLYSTRDFANFDVITVRVPGRGPNGTILGQMCSTSHDPERRTSVIALILIDAVILTVVLILLFVTYGIIVFKLCTFAGVSTSNTNIGSIGSRHDMEHSENSDRGSMTTTNKTASIKLSVTNVHGTNANETVATEKPKKIQGINKAAADVRGRSTQTVNRVMKTKCRQIKRAERDITIMMMVASIGLIACFTPYFAIKIWVWRSGTSEFEVGVLVQFLLRLPYINSVINPALYCLFNPRFRRFVAEILHLTRQQGSETERSPT